MPRPSQTRAYLALVASVVLWASFPAATKLALQDFPPSFLGALRITIAAGFLTVLLARSGAESIRGLSPGALGVFTVLAVLGIWGSTHFTYYAIHYSTASKVVLLSAVTPVFIALASRGYLGERLGKVAWLGVALSAAGVLLVITNGRLAALRPAEVHAGDLINLATLASWAAYTVYGKRVLSTHSPALATTAAYVIGAALTVPTAALVAPLFPAPRLGSPVAWLVVLYQAILGALAHVWWYRAVDVVGASRAAIFMYLQPVVGVLLATALLAERLQPWHLGGGALVVVGVALTTRGRER